MALLAMHGAMMKPRLGHARLSLRPVFVKPSVFFKSRPVLTNAKAPKVEVLPPEDEEEDEEMYDYDEGENIFDSLSAPEKRRVLAMKGLQAKYDGMQVDYLREMAELEAKYQAKYAPLFDERKQIIAGKKAVDKFDVEDDGKPDEGLPEFWLEALSNHSKIGHEITDRDADVLANLEDIRCDTFTGETRGWKLTFFFKDNEHFTNKVLTKEYHFEENELAVPKQFIGCKIQWKQGKDTTKETKKKKAVKGKASRDLVEVIPCDSFFNFFSPPTVPENLEGMSQTEMNEIEEDLNRDFDIGIAIKDSILPRAVEWFTGEAAQMYGDDEDYYDEDEDEYDN